MSNWINSLLLLYIIHHHQVLAQRSALQPLGRLCRNRLPLYNGSPKEHTNEDSKPKATSAASAGWADYFSFSRRWTIYWIFNKSDKYPIIRFRALKLVFRPI